MNKLNITIIGAGPIGLYIAILLKQRKDNEYINITLIEKRDCTNYIRENIVALPMTEIIRIFPMDLFKKLIKHGCYRKTAVNKCYKSIQKLFIIPLNKLEQECFDYIKNDITIINSDKISSKILNKSNIIIGTSGCKDYVGKMFLNAKLREYRKYYGMGVLFEPSQYNIYNEATHSNKSIPLRYAIFPTKKTNRYYMGISISKKTYDILCNTNECDYKLVHTIPKELNKIIKNGLAFYNVNQYKNLSIFPIGIDLNYMEPSIKTVTINNKKKLCVLIGDNLFTHHFFSGAGIISGFKCAYLLNKYINTTYKRGYKPGIIKRYKTYVTNLRKKKWSSYANNIVIPFDEIEKLTKNISRDRLNKIAEQNNIPYSKLNKLELAFVLGCKNIPECKGNKFARA